MMSEREYDSIRDRLSTRANSTLAIALATLPVSLTLLFIPNLSEFRIFGLTPSLLGILFREFTIFSSDRRDYDRLHILEEQLGIERVEMSRNERIVRGARSFIVRSLLALSIIIFGYIESDMIGLWLGVIVVTLSLIVIVFLEDRMMLDC